MFFVAKRVWAVNDKRDDTKLNHQHNASVTCKHAKSNKKCTKKLGKDGQQKRHMCPQKNRVWKIACAIEVIDEFVVAVGHKQQRHSYTQ